MKAQFSLPDSAHVNSLPSICPLASVSPQLVLASVFWIMWK